MLVLSILHDLLSQLLSKDLHTVILLTPSGELVSYAAEPQRAKDEIRVLVGLAGEVWQETKEQGHGMVDSELGRIAVVPVDADGQTSFSDEEQPMMLLALNSRDTVEYAELQAKGATLAKVLARSLGKFRAFIAPSRTSPTTSVPPSPLPPSRR